MDVNSFCRSCRPLLQCEKVCTLTECMYPTCTSNYSWQLQTCFQPTITQRTNEDKAEVCGDFNRSNNQMSGFINPEFPMQMVNVQSNSEFASHQLNRDTWSDPTVSSILVGSFIFWQVHHCTLATTHCYIMAMSHHNTLLHHGNVIRKQGL